MRTQALAAVACVLALGNTGCLVTADTDVDRNGVQVSENTLRQIEPGVTTGDWVQATLGPPTHRSRLDDGREVWRYCYTETKTSRGSVFLIFAGNDERRTERAVLMELRDGVVLRTWRA